MSHTLRLRGFSSLLSAHGDSEMCYLEAALKCLIHGIK